MVSGSPRPKDVFKGSAFRFFQRASVKELALISGFTQVALMRQGVPGPGASGCGFREPVVSHGVWGPLQADLGDVKTARSWGTKHLLVRGCTL